MNLTANTTDICIAMGWKVSKYLRTCALGLLLIALSGCGMFGPEPAATVEPTVIPFPTYTPTPQVEEQEGTQSSTPGNSQTNTMAIVPTATPSAITTATTAALVLEPTATNATLSATEPVTEEESTTESSLASPTDPPTSTADEPQLTVSTGAVNMRSGPDTTFAIVGSATQGETFALQARSADGGWWQICCVNGESAWVFGQLTTVKQAESVAVAVVIPTPMQPTPVPVSQPTAVPAEEPVVEAPPPTVDPYASSAGDFNPDAHYQVVHFKVLGLGENNGGIRDSGAQHHIFLTVLDQNGNGVDGAVVENLVGEKGTVVTGSKGPGKAEITMYWEPFKLRVASDPSGPVTSHTSNQMGLAFPHLPDLVGKLGDEAYEYGACPTIEIKCAWPIQAIHFSYEITFQKVK